MEEFVACFAEIVDPRQNNTRHDLHELLLIALCALLSGGEDCSDMALFGKIKAPYLRQFLRLCHGTPSHDTFSRVFRLLDPKAFETCFTRFMQRFTESLRGVVAVDGKTLRRSFDRITGKSPLHLVHAWSAEQRLLLGQVKVDDKSNEITAVPKLLELLSLKGCIVTADALNCQRAIAAKVIEQGGDYVLALKGNQGSLHDDVRCFFDDPARAAEIGHTTIDGDHGRIETRTSLVSTDIAWLQERHAWPGLAAIGRVLRTREVSAKITTETAYYLLSTPLSRASFLESAQHLDPQSFSESRRGCYWVQQTISSARVEVSLRLEVSLSSMQSREAGSRHGCTQLWAHRPPRRCAIFLVYQ